MLIQRLEMRNWKAAAAAGCVAGWCAAAQAAPIAITTTGADQEIYSDGSEKWPGQSSARVGDNGNNTKEAAYVMPFTLPTLLPGQTIGTADFKAFLQAISNNPPGDIDLYGLPSRDTASVDPVADFYAGATGGDVSATLLQDGFTTASPASTTDVYHGTSAAGDVALAAYLNGLYDAGAQGGDFAFLRLNMDTTNTLSSRFFFFTTANGDAAEHPTLTLTIIPEPASLALLGLAGVGLVMRRRTVGSR